MNTIFISADFISKLRQLPDGENFSDLVGMEFRLYHTTTISQSPSSYSEPEEEKKMWEIDTSFIQSHYQGESQLLQDSPPNEPMHLEIVMKSGDKEEAANDETS